MKPFNIIVTALIIIIYFRYGILHTNKILQSNRLGNKKKNFHCIMVWLIPFVWYWFLKDHIKPTEVMTKARRKQDKGNYYESGIGLWGE